jgi:hypothetical protein
MNPVFKSRLQAKTVFSGKNWIFSSKLDFLVKTRLSGQNSISGQPE